MAVPFPDQEALNIINICDYLTPYFLISYLSISFSCAAKSFADCCMSRLCFFSSAVMPLVGEPPRAGDLLVDLPLTAEVVSLASAAPAPPVA